MDGRPRGLGLRVGLQTMFPGRRVFVSAPDRVDRRDARPVKPDESLPALFHGVRPNRDEVDIPDQAAAQIVHFASRLLNCHSTAGPHRLRRGTPEARDQHNSQTTMCNGADQCLRQASTEFVRVCEMITSKTIALL